MALSAQQWLQKIHDLRIDRQVKIMNVCGGHERAITMAGLRGALPANIELIPGPGCPVCICPEEDIYHAIQLAQQENVILVAFGDMLRVPVNVPKREARSLEQAKALGADIRPIASPLDAVRIAQQHPQRDVVFFAAGFETTTAPVAAMLAQGVPSNLYILLSGRLTWPAVALIAPGHVATVMGPEEWHFVVDKHQMPAAIAGFTPVSLLAAMYSTLRQLQQDKRFLDNCYPEVVKPGGNATAKQQLTQVLQVTDANWRGVGMIPASGFFMMLVAVILPITKWRANAPVKCHRAVTAPAWYSARSILINAACMVRRAHRAHRSVRAWSPTKGRAGFGGAVVFANRCMPNHTRLLFNCAWRRLLRFQKLPVPI